MDRVPRQTNVNLTLKVYKKCINRTVWTDSQVISGMSKCLWHFYGTAADSLLYSGSLGLEGLISSPYCEGCSKYCLSHLPRVYRAGCFHLHQNLNTSPSSHSLCALQQPIVCVSVSRSNPFNRPIGILQKHNLEFKYEKCQSTEKKNLKFKTEHFQLSRGLMY